VAYATAALHRDRVTHLVYQETRPPGLPVPELLLASRERPFWSH
jgi:hypothetical protein